jgi:uncharacterized membrane protein YoaK (UPF0700 family)
MTLNEILLIIAFIALLTTPSLILRRVRQPLNTYIKLTSGFLLLLLVWFFADEGSLLVKLIMTTIVVSAQIKTLKEYLDSSRQTKRESH